MIIYSTQIGSAEQKEKEKTRKEGRMKIHKRNETKKRITPQGGEKTEEQCSDRRSKYLAAEKDHIELCVKIIIEH